jgi:hypothetical protein
MTVDQGLLSFAPDGGEAVAGFGWLHADDASEALGAEFDDDEAAVPRYVMPPPLIPAWPRVFPGL